MAPTSRWVQVALAQAGADAAVQQVPQADPEVQAGEWSKWFRRAHLPFLERSIPTGPMAFLVEMGAMQARPQGAASMLAAVWTSTPIQAQAGAEAELVAVQGAA